MRTARSVAARAGGEIPDFHLPILEGERLALEDVLGERPVLFNDGLLHWTHDRERDEREPRLKPMLAGAGEMYLLARIAELFRPLPRWARSVAAGAIMGVGLEAAIGAVAHAWRRS